MKKVESSLTREDTPVTFVNDENLWKLKEFYECQDENKFDYSRIRPKFSDGAYMGVWFSYNAVKILKDSNEICKGIAKQYEEYNSSKETKAVSKSLPQEESVKTKVYTKLIKEKSESNEKKFETKGDDNMSRKRNFYSEFNASKEEIDEIINSKLDIADSEVIISAWKGYLNGPHPKRDIINTPEYKNACDKVSKLLEEKKNNSNQKESSAFYDMFNGYSPYDIDKAFEKLTDKQKNIILKKWNGDIKKGIKKRGEFTKGENTSYSLAKKALINILSGKEKNSNDKDVKKERSKNVLNEKQLEIKLDAKNEVNMGEDTKTIQEQEKIESKITKECKKDTKEHKVDENEIYLKLFELVSDPYFMDVIKKLNKNDYNILFLKLNYPGKSIEELSDFTGMKMDDIKVSLSKGVDMIIDEFNSIIREMFNISDFNKTEDNSYKLR